MGKGSRHSAGRGAFGERQVDSALEEAGLEASMSRRGDCWDNAMAESLIKTVKTELGRAFLSRQLAQRQLFEYIEGFYNTRRLHSGLDYRTPTEVERLAAPGVLGLCLEGRLSRVVAPAAIAAPATTAPNLT